MNNDKLTFQLPSTPPPPWREFKNRMNRQVRAENYQPSEREVKLINAALMLRRPLLIEGPPGVGKSSLAHAAAYKLGLDDVLQWPITSKSTRQDGLYSYDALARLQEAALLEKRTAREDDFDQNNYQEAQKKIEDIGRYISLGPLGTALLHSTSDKPCVVLIDELDKSDIDLPNDLLHLFEEGEFQIPEIARLPDSDHADKIMVCAHNSTEKLPVERDGIVRCHAFPLVIMTSNGEREFPAAFLRRCLRLKISQPTEEELRRIIHGHLNMNVPGTSNEDLSAEQQATQKLLADFLDKRGEQSRLATGQLLDAMYLFNSGVELSEEENKYLYQAVFEALSE